ncbi:hypothetical protein AVEN_248827-1 [Araneus ventricosus]|uniref:Uncharacterized protein n=1 Tax=Araneus ventricosus TaxID=182803 RepID=A0A4Y2HYH9_ARAVE|nr:hypothetical protein AVEN_248827-1 [Araneus ventricosus]
MDSSLPMRECSNRPAQAGPPLPLRSNSATTMSVGTNLSQPQSSRISSENHAPPSLHWWPGSANGVTDIGTYGTFLNPPTQREIGHETFRSSPRQF